MSVADLLIPSPPPSAAHTDAVESIEDGTAIEEAAVSAPIKSSGETCPLALGTFVVSISRRCRFRRLHRIGDCPIRPGLDYHEFDELRMEEPGVEPFDARCRRCFRQPACAQSHEQPDEETLMSPSSSGSSSESGCLGQVLIDLAEPFVCSRKVFMDMSCVRITRRHISFHIRVHPSLIALR